MLLICSLLLSSDGIFSISLSKNVNCTQYKMLVDFGLDKMQNSFVKYSIQQKPFPNLEQFIFSHRQSKAFCIVEFFCIYYSTERFFVAWTNLTRETCKQLRKFVTILLSIDSVNAPTLAITESDDSKSTLHQNVHLHQ